ncbi:MAG TPA: hypothetical protein VNH19_02125 [Candidatus Limnocylindrales bacterium]|nr:hypothetical protein [Candidatus Limnocylindrales bacterium]
MAQDHKPLLEKTFTCTIYDEETKTWGIVNQPQSQNITFRLKNQSSDKLKAATEKLIRQLQTARRTHGPDSRPAFSFQPRVEVFEANSEDHAFYGEILKPRSFRQAVKEREQEARIGLFAGIGAAILLLLTSPPVATHVVGDVNLPWGRWASGNYERFATAALVTTTVSWLEVIMHWLFTLRQPIILWK